MMDRELRFSAMEAIKFYGSVASTNGIEEPIKKIANKNIKRLIDGLAPDVDQLIAALSGITIITDEES